MINKKNIKNLILSDINNYITLFEDTASIDSIESEYSNEYRFFTEEGQKFIDNNLAEKQKINPKLFNGTIYGLVNFEVYGCKIFITFEKGDFKTYLATIESGYKKYIEEKNFFIIPISVGNVIITKDNKIILGAPNKNKYKLIGGFIDSDDIINNKISPLNCSIRECKEEIGDLKLYDHKIIGIAQKHVCTIFANCKTDYTSKEIREIWQNNKDLLKDSYEMEKMLFVDNNESSIGNIIKGCDVESFVKMAFKFHLKENFSNYEYINIKI